MLELPAALAQNDKISKFYSENLNSSQKIAVENALTDGSHGLPLFTIVHGPPGTGKTSTVTEIVLQAAVRNVGDERISPPLSLFVAHCL
jgi:DNA polymerase alpha-associated DNA helicase A